MDMQDFTLKIVIVGDSGVGKTNLLSRFTRNIFDSETRNTIGVDFSALDLVINNKNVKIQFWDTAGQEKYRAIASAYYKNAHGAIIVYDITNKSSFENTNTWLRELKEHGEDNIKIALFGNKKDLESNREIIKEDAENVAKTNELFFMEVSAKTNEDKCVNTAFTCFLEEIMKYQDKLTKDFQNNKRDIKILKMNKIELLKPDWKKTKSKCCY